MFMARLPRVDIGNIVYHILNRANARLSIFHNKEDYRLFESILEEAQEKFKLDMTTRLVGRPKNGT